jgi:hypothetical protein
MWNLVAILATCAGCLVVAYLFLFARQRRRYRRLEALQQDALSTLAAQVRLTPPADVPDFGKRITVVPDLLPAELFAQLRAAARGCQHTERSYLPGHKKGGTISYEELHRLAPEMVALYQSADLREFCSAVAGTEMVPTPLHDQSSCSLLVYDRPGDHIGWHYDHNFYRGRHFTALIALVNERHGTDQSSSAQLVTRQGGQEVAVPMPPGTFVLFEGARVRHKVTPLGENETRITLSMTFCTDPAAPLLKAIARRFKDIAFFGVRALWT